MKIRRILVLTSGTGGGHNARAYAFKSWVKKLHGESVDVRVETILENSGPLTRFGVRLYNWIQGSAPILHNVYWWIVEFFGVLNSTFWFIGHSYYRNLLRRYKPHIIFSVHDATNGVFFRIAKKVLNLADVKCIIYCSEFSGGFGYSRHWVTRYADLFYSRTLNTHQFAVKLGIKPEKAKVLQNLLPPDTFSKPQKSRESKHEFRTKELGLELKKFTIFLTTGSVGANNHLLLLEALLPLADKVQVIVVCGKNQSQLNKLLKWRTKNSILNMYLEGYSTRIHNLIGACDVIVMRGGSNTATEALFHGCPIIFNCIESIMPQERLTINYFLRHNAAIMIKTPADFQRIVIRWMEVFQSYRKVKENLNSLSINDDPRTLVNEIVDLAKLVRYKKKQL